MIRRTRNSATKSAGTMNLVRGIFSVVAAALIVASFAGLVMAMEAMLSNTDILYGKVTAVDTYDSTKSLTLQSSDPSEPVMNIFVNDKTAVKMCEASKSLRDIPVGSSAQVTYHELAGVAVADFIYTRC